MNATTKGGMPDAERSRGGRRRAVSRQGLDADRGAADRLLIDAGEAMASPPHVAGVVLYRGMTFEEAVRVIEGRRR